MSGKYSSSERRPPRRPGSRGTAPQVRRGDRRACESCTPPNSTEPTESLGKVLVRDSLVTQMALVVFDLALDRGLLLLSARICQTRLAAFGLSHQIREHLTRRNLIRAEGCFREFVVRVGVLTVPLRCLLPNLPSTRRVPTDSLPPRVHVSRKRRLEHARHRVVSLSSSSGMAVPLAA